MSSNDNLESLSKKERKNYAKTLRESQINKDKKIKLIFSAIVVLIVLAAGFGLYLLAITKDSSLPKELGEKIAVDPKTGQQHIEVGEQHLPYSSNPPASGPHYNKPGEGPLECKFFDSEVKDEGAIHNLEHGAIWITYKNNDAELKKNLRKIVDDNSKVIISYRPANDSALVVASWGRLLKLDSFDQKKIDQFIKLYKNGSDAPEPLAGCGTAGMK